MHTHSIQIRRDVGGGSFLPIPVEFTDSYQAQHLYDDVITISTIVQMTTTPYKAMDQNSISMTPFVKTIIILNDLFWSDNLHVYHLTGEDHGEGGGGFTQTFKT